jgi:hypothetical protein
MAEDVPGRLDNALLALAAEEGHQQDVLGFEEGVALEFADPVTVRRLAGEETAAGPLDGPEHGRERPRVLPDGGARGG